MSLPPYNPFHGRKWANLPERLTPITASALDHVDTWLSSVRSRIETVAAQLQQVDAAKANTTTTITAGSGLDGGGDLSTSRTLSVEWGAGNEQVPRGDSVVYRPAGVTKGDLLIGQTGGSVARLPKASGATRVLSSSSGSDPGWTDPGLLGLGLPAAPYSGALLVGKADGSWGYVEQPDNDAMTLQTDYDNNTDRGGVSWVKNPAVNAVYEDRALIPTSTFVSAFEATNVLRVEAAASESAGYLPKYRTRSGSVFGWEASASSKTALTVKLFDRTGNWPLVHGNTWTNLGRTGVLFPPGFRPSTLLYGPEYSLPNVGVTTSPSNPTNQVAGGRTLRLRLAIESGTVLVQAFHNYGNDYPYWMLMEAQGAFTIQLPS